MRGRTLKLPNKANFERAAARDTRDRPPCRSVARSRAAPGGAPVLRGRMPCVRYSALFPGATCARRARVANSRESKSFPASHGDPNLSSRENEDRSHVASEAKGVTGLAERYGAALFDLADERKELDAVAGDLQSLRAMLRDSAEFRRLIRSPVVTREAQGKALEAIAAEAKLSPLVCNFLGVLAQNRRLFVLPEIVTSFLSQLAERRGEVTAAVVAAQDLTPAQRAAVDEQLRKAVGRKVAIDLQVDPSLLGGLVVKVGSRMSDASLKSKLHRLQLAMKGVQ